MIEQLSESLALVYHQLRSIISTVALRRAKIFTVVLSRIALTENIKGISREFFFSNLWQFYVERFQYDHVFCNKISTGNLQRRLKIDEIMQSTWWHC